MLRNNAEIISEAKNAYLNSNKHATVVLPTGSGKSFLALEIIKDLRVSSVLILAPSRALSSQWTKLLKDKLFIPYQVFTYKSALQRSLSADIVIYDEVHRAVSKVHKRTLSIPSTYKLGLTATLPDREDLREVLFHHLPVVYEMTIHTSVIHPKVKYLAIPVEDPEVMKKYKSLSNTIRTLNAQLVIKGLDTGGNIFLKIKNELSKSYSNIRSLCYTYLYFVRKRKEAIYLSEAKVEVVKKIVKSTQSKFLIFSPSIYIAKQIVSQVGGIFYDASLPDKERDRLLHNSLHTNVIVSCEAIKEGINIPQYEKYHVIFVGGSKSVWSFTQAIGRAVRPSNNCPDRTVLIISLFIPSTVDELWMISRMKDSKIQFCCVEDAINIVKATPISC